MTGSVLGVSSVPLQLFVWGWAFCDTGEGDGRQGLRELRVLGHAGLDISNQGWDLDADDLMVMEMDGGRPAPDWFALLWVMDAAIRDPRWDMSRRS